MIGRVHQTGRRTGRFIVAVAVPMSLLLLHLQWHYTVAFVSHCTKHQRSHHSQRQFVLSFLKRQSAAAPFVGREGGGCRSQLRTSMINTPTTTTRKPKGVRQARRGNSTSTAVASTTMTMVDPIINVNLLTQKVNHHDDGQIIGDAITIATETITPTSSFSSVVVDTPSNAVVDDTSEQLNKTTTKTTKPQPPYDPTQFGSIPFPNSLSPSSILEFQKCPQSFLFQYLYGLKQPTTPVLVKGSMCHAALEQIFDLAPSNRTLTNLQNLFRSNWSTHRNKEEYRSLFPNLDDEITWGQEGLQLLKNYLQVEDPATIPIGTPALREVWVSSQLAVNPREGSTGYTLASPTPSASSRSPPRVSQQERQLPTPRGNDDISTTAAAVDSTYTITNNATHGFLLDSVPSYQASVTSTSSGVASYNTFLVRGIVDRLDLVKIKGSREVVLRLIDYKTGKAPDLKYSPSMNQKIQSEAFEQLLMYALLLREKQKIAPEVTITLPLRYLRLFFLTSIHNKATTMEIDLGETAEERDRVLQSVHQRLSKVWTTILDLVSKQDPKAFVGCSRSFCYCHTCRAQFIPGTVWEPPPVATSSSSGSSSQGNTKNLVKKALL